MLREYLENTVGIEGEGETPPAAEGVPTEVAEPESSEGVPIAAAAPIGSLPSIGLSL